MYGTEFSGSDASVVYWKVAEREILVFITRKKVYLDDD